MSNSLFQGDPVFIFYSFDQHKYTSVFFRDMTRNVASFFFLCCLSDLFSVSLSISLLLLHLHSSSLPARHIYMYICIFFFFCHLDACYYPWIINNSPRILMDLTTWKNYFSFILSQSLNRFLHPEIFWSRLKYLELLYNT